MGATTSKVDGPLETLDADQVRNVVAGFGTQFAGAADKMREAGIDGDYLAHASDDDLAVVFEECGLTNKLQQSLLKQKLRKALTRAPVAPPPLPPRPISPPPEAPTPPASPKAKAPAPLRVRVTCPADAYAAVWKSNTEFERIEQTQLRGRRRVDGVGNLIFTGTRARRSP